MDMSLDEVLRAVYRRQDFKTEVLVGIVCHSALLGDEISKDYAMLKNIIDRHESVIRETWKKKRCGRRENVILKVLPKIPRKHRPDYEVWLRKRAEKQNDEQSSVQGEVLWPFLNLEDLCQTQPILMFLNARGRNTPWTFAGSELLHSPYATWTGCKRRTGCWLYNVFTEDPHSGCYGHAFMDNSEHQPPQNALKRCRQDGLLVLKIQHQIYKFLVQFCQEILSETFQESERPYLEYPIQPEPPALQFPLNNQGYTTMTAFNLLGPYRGRSSIDFARLHDHALALLNNARDHLWSLREDPSYLMDLINFRRRNHPSYIRNMLMQENYWLPAIMDAPAFSVDGGRRIIVNAYWNTGLMQCLVEHLSVLKDTFRDGVVHNLPEGFTTVYSLLNHSKVTCQRMVEELQFHVRSAPGLRDFYYFTGCCGERHTETLPRPMQLDQNEQELMWIFSIVEESISICKKCSFSKLALAIERLDFLIRTDKRIRQLITSEILEDIAVLSVVVECIRQVYAWFWHPEVSQFEEACMEDYEEKLSRNLELVNYRDWFIQMEKHEPPFKSLDSLANYPIHDYPSAVNINAMIQAEELLDAFWKDIDNYMEQKTGVAQHPFISQCLVGELRRTSPLAAQPDQVKPAEYIYIPLSRQLHDESKQITGTFNKLSIHEKPKKKLRRNANNTPKQADDDNEANATTLSPPKPRKKFTLHRRPYQVFKTIMGLHAADPGSCPKVVKWPDFIHAMTCVGFAVEKLQGSAWQFTPGKDSDVARGIQFHEPHPESDIPYAMARRFGRRLERVYGWDRDSFELE
ncbi:hypothetical protein DM02DRAFT_689572 [Periconia macrospinosa]|uniref:Uncharacterized protein n=1 Tax=Periconia macrospinosa TaxID=97972 RepID=A0A2V1DCH9_9PLEO|nr:hypothetical protein DM02DRAFT_689572 [Periconia macrospinosa]